MFEMNLLRFSGPCFLSSEIQFLRTEKDVDDVIS